ncbi:MAG: hypothetical protein AAB739_01310 [Patescibacteria group bacterium]
MKINTLIIAIAIFSISIGLLSTAVLASEISTLTVKVLDDKGNYLKDAQVEIYQGNYFYDDSKKNLNALKTNEKGEIQFILPDNLFSTIWTTYIVVVAKKENFISSFRDNFNVKYKTNTDITIKLNSPLPPTDWSLADMSKLQVIQRGTLGPLVANESSPFIYALRFKPELYNKIKRVNAHLIITTPSTEPSNTALYEFTKNSIDIYQPQSFTLNLPAGNYGYYFYFDIKYKDGSSEAYPKPYQTMMYYFENNYVADGFAYNFAVVPSSNYSECLPLNNAGQNNNDENKLNILFINIGEDPSLFQAVAKQMTEGKYNFMAMEPFSSNKEKFQFWYATENLSSLDEIKPNETINYQLINKTLTTDTLPTAEKIKKSCHLPNRQIVYIMKTEGSGWGVKCVDGYVRIEVGQAELDKCLKYKDQNYCLDILRYDALLAHEFGHQFAELVEEYTSDKQLDTTTYFKKYKNPYGIYDPFKEYGSYYSFLIDAAKDCVVSGGGEGQYLCAPNPNMKKDCKKNAKWRGLIGYGCGSKNKEDCKPNNPQSVFEVNCDNMGGGKPEFGTVMKPTKISLMGSLDDLTMGALKQNLFNVLCSYAGNEASLFCETSYEPKNRLYGPVNERQICRFMKLITGKTGGACHEYLK